jgi:UPF0042 nucleotide-binding protein
VVDNLPPALIGKMAELAAASGTPARVAIVADVRGGVFFSELSKGLEELKELKISYRILFLDASDDDLVRRYERLMMQSLKESADLIVDSTGMTPHDLRDRVRELFARSPTETRVHVSIVSFGYKNGLPRDADLVMDVRFLPNPHWIERLRPLPGTDPTVREYVTQQRAYGEFMRKLRSLMNTVVPGYVSEGKSYLTIAVGCTGGRHRSVVVAEDLADYFRKHGQDVVVDHRDLDRG